MDQNKLLLQFFNQKFHLSDFNHNIDRIPSNTKNIPTINILNSYLQIKDKETKLNNTSVTIFRRLIKQPPSFSKSIPYNINKENI